RRGHDDATAAALHGPDGLAHPEHDAVEVDPHDAAVLVVGELLDLAAAGDDPGVEVRDVDPAEVLLGLPERLGHVGRLRDVASDELAADLVRGALAELLVEVVHNDPGTLRGEPASRGQADPRPAAGDDRALALEQPHRGPYVSRARRRARRLEMRCCHRDGRTAGARRQGRPGLAGLAGEAPRRAGRRLAGP